MSFGVVQSMIISLRNNSRKKGLSHFKRRDMLFQNKKSKFEKLTQQKASPEQLKKIRNKLKKEQQVITLKTVIIFVLIIVLLVITFLFIIN